MILEYVEMIEWGGERVCEVKVEWYDYEDEWYFDVGKAGVVDGYRVVVQGRGMSGYRGGEKVTNGVARVKVGGVWVDMKEWLKVGGYRWNSFMIRELDAEEFLVGKVVGGIDLGLRQGNIRVHMERVRATSVEEIECLKKYNLSIRVRELDLTGYEGEVTAELIGGVSADTIYVREGQVVEGTVTGEPSIVSGSLQSKIRVEGTKELWELRFYYTSFGYDYEIN